MPLVSGYIEDVYSSKVLKIFEKILPQTDISNEDIYVYFNSGVTLSGLNALKEVFHKLVTSMPAVSRSKTINIREILDPRGESDLGDSIQQHYTGVMGYRIYTKMSHYSRDVSLDVWLWKESTDLVYPLEAKAKVEVDADGENA